MMETTNRNRVKTVPRVTTAETKYEVFFGNNSDGFVPIGAVAQSADEKWRIQITSTAHRLRIQNNKLAYAAYARRFQALQAVKKIFYKPIKKKETTSCFNRTKNTLS